MSSPQYPVVNDETYIDASLTRELPSEEINFAEDVRRDRLAIVWKVTLVTAFAIGWSLVVLTGDRRNGS